MTSSPTAPGMSPACRKTQLMSSFGPAMNPSSDIIVWTKTLPITTSAIAIDNRTRTGRQTHRPSSLGRTLAQTDTYSRDLSTDLGTEQEWQAARQELFAAERQVDERAE